MSVPLLIDTDVGIDDAAAIALALASDAVELRALCGVGGNVSLAQGMTNLGRLLTALAPPAMPMIGRGLDPPPALGHALADRRDIFGEDGLGECDLPGAAPAARDFREVYHDAIESAEGEIVLVCLGPPTNLAALWRESPDLLRAARQIYVTGGAVWARGGAEKGIEFNFHRDPASAEALLQSGLPITVSPLDVTCLVCFDESNVARMAASGYRTGEVLARMLPFPIEHDPAGGPGRTVLPDLVTLGSLIWPALYLKTRARLEVATSGTDAGRCKPALGGDPAQRVDLLTAVNAVDLLENVLESLCHEAFVV